MKKNLMLLLLCVFALGLFGCSGSDEIVEPNRDNLNTEPATPRSIANMQGE